MKNIAAFFFLLVSLVPAQSLDAVQESILTELRLKYYSAVEESDSVKALEQMVTELSKSNKLHSDEILTAYRGGIMALKAKHAFWPFSKLSYLNESMEILDSIISKVPDNLEIRFMRYSILHYVPDFLGWGDEKKADASKIYVLLMAKEYKGLPDELITGITQFMLDSDRLSPLQEAELESEILLTLGR